MNDPVALLLVTGFIDWIQDPGYGAEDMIVNLVVELTLGAVLGVAIGFAARWAVRNVDLPTRASTRWPRWRPRCPTGWRSCARLGLPRRLPHGPDPGNGHVPARRTMLSFHQGLSWVSQIALFFLLGLLVFPSES